MHFFSWSEKKGSKSVSMASFAALIDKDINIICQRGSNIVYCFVVFFFMSLVSSAHFYFALGTHVIGVIV